MYIKNIYLQIFFILVFCSHSFTEKKATSSFRVVLHNVIEVIDYLHEVIFMLQEVNVKCSFWWSELNESEAFTKRTTYKFQPGAIIPHISFWNKRCINFIDFFN